MATAGLSVSRAVLSRKSSWKSFMLRHVKVHNCNHQANPHVPPTTYCLYCLSNDVSSLLKQYVAGERVDLLDDYDFPARTITDAQ